MNSDEELMLRVRKGDHAAFAHLVQRHTNHYLRFAVRILRDKSEAEDIVQAAFIKLWQNPHRWNPKKSAFKTWFYTVLLNACRDVQRQRSRTETLEPREIEASLKPSASEQAHFEQAQQEATRQSCLQYAIARLPTAQRDAINLVVYNELPQRQAAEVLGISLKALESLLSRAKTRLRRDLFSSENAHAA